MRYYSTIKRSKIFFNMTEPWKHCDCGKSPAPLYDSICMNYPEQTNPWRQQPDSWLPGAGGGVGVLGSDCSVSVGFPFGVV